MDNNEKEVIVESPIEVDIMRLLFYKDMTFTELSKELKKLGYKISGEQVLMSGEVAGGIWWLNMSEDFRDAILNLFKGGRLKAKHTTPEVYNREFPTKLLPLKKLNNPKYKNMFVWVPVLLASKERIEGLTPKKSKYLS